MRVTIAAIGRLRSGPECDLTADYLARAAAQGRTLGFRAADLVEVAPKTPGSVAESEALAGVGAPGARRVLLDERGAQWTSPQLAEALATWRDDGAPETVFMIGGADGVSEKLRTHADQVLAFGRMVWPHKLVRVMIAEQIYRAVTILSANPYHRD